MGRNSKYIMHVYRAITKPKRYTFDDLVKAMKFGDTIWNTNQMYNGSMYKIKLWDLSLGKIEENNPNAKGLIREWV